MKYGVAAKKAVGARRAPLRGAAGRAWAAGVAALSRGSQIDPAP